MLDIDQSSSLTLSLMGLGLLSHRLLPLLKKPPTQAISEPAIWPKVSIIVPARNEEAVLGTLLRSLNQLDYPDYEVIVVDDQSTDGTAEVAEKFSHFVKLVRGQPCPEEWHGKQWACHQGSQIAVGELLLFTDADTIHHRHGLKKAVHQRETSGADLYSSVPFHQNPERWEQWLGPFQMMLLAVTGPAQKPRPGRVYCVGQYLLFTRTYYQKIGGHQAVADVWIDDIPLANLTLKTGARYHLNTNSEIFSVRMYQSLTDFLRGWRRNFRAGMGLSVWWAPLEIGAYIAALTGGGQAFNSKPQLIIATTATLLMMKTQGRMGTFSPWGAVFSIWSIILFSVVTCFAVADMMLQRKFKWKGRSYE